MSRPSPLGATVLPDGVNVSLFFRSATGVELLLFGRDDDARPARVIRLDPAANRTYFYWHVFVAGVREGQLAAPPMRDISYRAAARSVVVLYADGPDAPM